MFSITGLIDRLFTLYEILILARIIISWLRVSYYNPWIRLIGRLTDPYLNLFRSLVPPFGAVDFSPVLALIALMMLERVVLFLLAGLSF